MLSSAGRAFSIFSPEPKENGAMSEMKITSFKTLPRWKKYSHRILGDIGGLGYILRLIVLLIFAIYFVVPFFWLLLAPSKDQFTIISANPLAFGSWETVLKSWQNINAYQNGAIWLWFRNSIVYVGSSLVIGLVVSIPAGYIL